MLLFARSDRAEARAKGLGGPGAALFAFTRRRLAAAVAELGGVDLVVAGASGGLRAHHVLPQRGGDFGARFGAAIEDARALGYAEVVAVGLDVPRLDAGCLAAAFRALATTSVVLGPSPDGGVYLVGVAGAALGGLTRVRWLGRSVQSDLRAAYPGAAWIEARSDVDSARDARRAARRDRGWARVLRVASPPAPVARPVVGPRRAAWSAGALGIRGPPSA